MADKPVTTDVAAGSQYDASVFNDNFTILENAIEGCLGREGTSEYPNSMEGDLDLNLNRLLNLPAPSNDKEAVNKAYCDSLFSGTTTLPVGQISSAKISGNAVAWDTVNNNSITTTFENYNELKGIDAFIDGDGVLLLGRVSAGDGGGGTFYWDSSDMSTEVTSDTQSGIYVPPNSDTTGSSGAWVRQCGNTIDIKWFGAVGDGVTDDTDSIKAAVVYAQSKRSSTTRPSSYNIVGAGDFLISSQITFNGCNVDMYNSRFILAAAFPDSVAIIATQSNGNVGAAYTFKLQVYGDRTNQTSSIISVAFYDANHSGSEIYIKGESCNTLVAIYGNVENQTFNISGYDCELLCHEDTYLTNTPDENVYNLSGNTNIQVFTQSSSGVTIDTSCVLNLNQEQAGSGGTDYPIIIRTNKVVIINGIMRSNHNGAVHIESGTSSEIINNLSLFTTYDDVAYKITECGSLSGVIVSRSCDSGTFLFSKINYGGTVDLVVTSNSGGSVLTLGNTTDRVYNQKINLMSRCTDTSQDLDLVYAQDCTIDILRMTVGITFGVGIGCKVSLPRNVIEDDIPITLSNASYPNSNGCDIEVRGVFLDAELQAYSTPCKLLRATGEEQAGARVYYTGAGATGGWQVPTMSDL